MDKEFIAIMGAITAIILTAIIGASVYHINLTNKMTQLIESGQDPIAVACAFDARGKEAICAINQK